VNIETFNLNLGRYAKSDSLVDNLKDDEHYHKYISSNTYEAQSLDAELCQTAAVEKTLADTVCAGGEKSYSKRTPDTVNHVDGNGTDGIVDFRDLIEKLNREHYDEAGNKSDKERTYGRYAVAGSGNRNEAAEGRIERHRYVRLTIANPCEDHGNNSRNRCSEVCVEANETC